MTDRMGIDTVLRDCERYWRAAGIRRRTVAGMRQELDRHLTDALGAGGTIQSVVGPDTAAFAREWAAAERGSTEALPSWEDAVRDRRRPFRWWDAVMLIVVAAAVVAVFVATSGDEGGSSVDNETWRFIWVGAAVFLGFAEVVTAGFFMLPFAIGAVIAAVLAFTGVAPAVQLVVFIGTSIIALVGLQRFVRFGDEHKPMVGANRFVDQTAVVLEDIDRVKGEGRVRMATEIWRATTEGGPIAAGTEVVVTDVEGARLVVEPAE